MPIDRAALDRIAYRKNFLAEVVARVDFLAPLNALAKDIPKPLAEAITKRFPIAEPRKAELHEVHIAEAVQDTKVEFTEWNFFGREREKRLALSREWLLGQYTTYVRYEDLRAEFTDVVTKVVETFPDAQPRRLGLRYINKMTFPGDGPLAWNDWFTAPIPAALPSRYPEALVRSIQVCEFNFEEFRLRFQYGIANPDFPAVIRQRVFLLDLDAFTDSAFDPRELPAKLDLFHLQIQDFFESSLTARAREAMNVA